MDQHTLPEEFWADIEHANEAVALALVEHAVRRGDAAPNFSLPSTDGQQVMLRSRLREGPVVLSFHRGGWCPHCRLESRTLSQILPAIRHFGATVLGISPEQRPRAAKVNAESAIGYQWLTDVCNVVGRDYGLVHPVQQSVFASAGIDLGEYNADGDWALPVPATYVIAPTGIVEYAFASADVTERADLAEVLATLRRLSHG